MVIDVLLMVTNMINAEITLSLCISDNLLLYLYVSAALLKVDIRVDHEQHNFFKPRFKFQLVNYTVYLLEFHQYQDQDQTCQRVVSLSDILGPYEKF